jgi:micrococcal nuclease
MKAFRSAILLQFLCLLLILPSACKLPFQSLNVVKVVQVIDGDTIVIEGGYHVRYIGVDSPETNEFYYSEATQMNTDLVAGKEVRLETDVSDRDKYGRLLRYVYAGDVFVNAEMVRQGCAWATAYPPDVKYQVYLEAMESEARQLKRGFWK